MSLLEISPVIPIAVLQDPCKAAPVARALAAGGITILEVTLRTSAALACIERIAAEVPEVMVGAGTVTSPAQIAASVSVGARFVVSPGTTPELGRALFASGVPALPGCATVSEAMALRELGFSELKLFPAEASGGPRFLASIFGPLPDLRFCPTGGITLERAPDYLALPNVSCVGGSWLTPPTAIAEGAWDVITAAALATQRRLVRA